MIGTVSAPEAVSRRALQRRETRERIYEAALKEIARSGLAAADVGAIAAAAGVARGTFYFHFPTKEDVLVELEQREELRIIASLERRAASAGDLRALLAAVVREVRASERRLGPSLLRDTLSIHFASASADSGRLDDHPLATFVVNAVRDARRVAGARTKVDAPEVALIFLTGLYALLATRGGPSRERDALLDTYVATIIDGVGAA